jgi:acetyl-CoA synthetase
MENLIPVPQDWTTRAKVDSENYAARYTLSLQDPHTFWDEECDRLKWIKRPRRFDESSFAEADFQIRWFSDGSLNVSENCVDRHLGAHRDQLAILWEPDDPGEPHRQFTYGELHAEVCRFANVLKATGVGKGDRVTLYLPMIPEAAFAMLACARVGAIHSVVFGGFSPEALAGRIQDCDSKLVVTADEGRRLMSTRLRLCVHRCRTYLLSGQRAAGSTCWKVETSGMTRLPPRCRRTARRNR